MSARSVINDPYGMGVANNAGERPTVKRDAHADAADAMRFAAWTPEMQREHDDAEQARELRKQTVIDGRGDFENGLKLHAIQMWLARYALVIPVVIFVVYYICTLLTDEP